MTTSSVKMLGFKNAFGQAIEKILHNISDDMNVLQNRNGVNEPNNNHAFFRTFSSLIITKVFLNPTNLLDLSDGSYKGLK